MGRTRRSKQCAPKIINIALCADFKCSAFLLAQIAASDQVIYFEISLTAHLLHKIRRVCAFYFFFLRSFFGKHFFKIRKNQKHCSRKAATNRAATTLSIVGPGLKPVSEPSNIHPAYK